MTDYMFLEKEEADSQALKDLNESKNTFKGAKKI